MIELDVGFNVKSSDNCYGNRGLFRQIDAGIALRSKILEFEFRVKRMRDYKR